MSELKIPEKAVSPYQSQSIANQSQNVNIQRLKDISDLAKVYINNVFVGIARIAENGSKKIPEHQVDSIKILTGNTEAELLKVFKEVIGLDTGPQKKEIHEIFSTIILFIEEFSRLKPFITKCDMDSLVERIEHLEKAETTPELTAALKRYREIISAFKIDKILNHGILERNNAYNLRYYNDKWQDGFATLGRLMTLLDKTELGDVETQLSDLVKMGKIRKEDGLNLNQLNHGDLVCYDTFDKNMVIPEDRMDISEDKMDISEVRIDIDGSPFRQTLTFVIVDKLGDQTLLRVPGRDQPILFQPHDNVLFSRIQL